MDGRGDRPGTRRNRGVPLRIDRVLDTAWRRRDPRACWSDAGRRRRPGQLRSERPARAAAGSPPRPARGRARPRARSPGQGEHGRRRVAVPWLAARGGCAALARTGRDGGRHHQLGRRRLRLHRPGLVGTPTRPRHRRGRHRRCRGLLYRRADRLADQARSALARGAGPLPARTRCRGPWTTRSWWRRSTASGEATIRRRRPTWPPPGPGSSRCQGPLPRRPARRSGLGRRAGWCGRRSR